MARQYTLHRPPVPEGSKINFAAELNAQQLAAVLAPPGPSLVIAGAGSGKTRTLTYRVAYLIENGVAPSGILLLTFTNKASREMLERVASIIPHDLAGLWGGTFHSVGNRILRAHAHAAGFAPGFSIMDREDQDDMMDAVVAALGVDPKDKRFPKGTVVADILSYALNTGREIKDVLVEKYPAFVEFADRIAEARKRYEDKKRAANALDFDDLLEKTVRLLSSDADVAARYQRQFQFILVDEYQDTNHLQGQFIDLLAGHHRNVMVVGDDAQSIYSWRGADFRNILDFPKRYANAQVYKIETNYRSAPEILAVANAAIAANVEQFKKTLITSRPPAEMKPALVPLMTSGEQAMFVVQRIMELESEYNVPLAEMAVLYRAHFHSMELQMELTRRGVPFSITSGLRFFEQAHVKDVAAFLKLAVNPRDEVAFKRAARLLPGVGAGTAEKLWSQAASQLALDGAGRFSAALLGLKVPARAVKGWEQFVHTLDELVVDGQPILPAAMIQIVLEAVYDDYARAQFPNYDQRRDDLNTLMNFSRQFDSAAEFLDQLALATNLDPQPGTPRAETELVTLSSVHQAKGLEWRAVFVIGLADGMFPSFRSLDADAALEEERRLFYVAVTRAKEQLYLTYPTIRAQGGYGTDSLQRPSRFLGEVGKELVEEWEVGGVF